MIYSSVLFIGGQAHTDVYGVRYRADPLKTGIASDYGSRLNLQRVDRSDAILYQTERLVVKSHVLKCSIDFSVFCW